MMSSEYRLPALPLGGSEATILRWLKQPGEQVAVGDALVIVVNERAEVALPASLSGILTQQLLAEGEATAAGAPLAMFSPAEQVGVAGAPVEQAEPPRRVTPVARRVAMAAGLDLRELAGSGVSGRVTKADVLATLAPAGEPAPLPLAEPARASPAPPDMPTRGLAQAGAETQVLTAIDVDVERVRAVRDRLSPDFARRGLALTDTVCVLAAIVATLPRHPLLNCSWYEDAILARRQIDLAVLAGARHMLVRGAQDLNMRGLARALQHQPESAIDQNTFVVVEYTGPIWWGQPALATRNSAVLGIGAVCARPIVQAHNGIERIVVHRTMILSLAYDARVLDQCHADAFLRDLKLHLERFSG